MKRNNHIWLQVTLFCFVISFIPVRAESLEDRSSSISPKHIPGQGEFMHGQGYGKLMIRVLMLGAVPQQGIHYVPEGTDLMFAILYSGGYTELTKLDDITIRRRFVKELIEVDLADLLEEGQPVPKLMDGDVVSIPFNWRKNFQTILTVTGFVTSLTGFALSMIALTRK